MQRGSSRLNASIFPISSSNLLTKSSSFDALSGTFPMVETTLRKSWIVLGTKLALKSRLSSDGIEPIFGLNMKPSLSPSQNSQTFLLRFCFFVLFKKFLRESKKMERCETVWELYILKKIIRRRVCVCIYIHIDIVRKVVGARENVDFENEKMNIFKKRKIPLLREK